MKWRFKENTTFDDRRAEANLIRVKYPHHVPIIMQKAPNATVPSLKNEKYLYPPQVTVAQLMSILREHVSIGADVAIFLIVGNTLPSSCCTLGELYKDQGDSDGFLYVAYMSESAFG